MSENIKNIIQNIDFKQSIFINHQDVFFLFLTIEKSMIFLTLFDMNGSEIIKVTINPRIARFFALDKSNTPQTPTIEYQEQILESKIEHHFYYVSNIPEFLYLGNVEKDRFTSVNKVKNLFGHNIHLLISNNNSSAISEILRVSESNIYKNFKNSDSVSNVGRLSEICGSFGYPHNVINLTDGYQLFIYYGVHSCKKNNTAGVLIFKININGEISGIYELYNFCSCFNEKNEIKIYQNEINYN